MAFAFGRFVRCDEKTLNIKSTNTTRPLVTRTTDNAQ